MEYSDDEMELVLQAVTNYYFVDANEEPISFAVLPVSFEGDCVQKPKQEVFLHGIGDGGLQKVYKHVTAWKLAFRRRKEPEVMVLTKDKKWIQLLNPRKSYLPIVRTVLVTVHALHFLKRKPQSSAKGLWDHVHGAFKALEHRPSAKDLEGHCPLVRLIMAKHDALAKSQLLLGLLKDKKMPFPIDYDLRENVRNDDGDESDDDLDLFDTVCAICDNGGGLICCEGRCMRTFHATKKDGEDSNCESLGFSEAQVKDFQKFLCKNCEYNKHQCFGCGKLGSSDKAVGAEVFPCVNLTCGHFYHPKCVADLLFETNKIEAAKYEKRIASGKSFTCPVHRCHVCKQGENRGVKELQFAVCRRCPKAYHRKCLPRRISFEDIEKEGIVQRAWEDLLPNRILIYCLKHVIEPDFGTPVRNHLIFPKTPARKKKKHVSDFKEPLLKKCEQSVPLDSRKSPEGKEDPKIMVEIEKGNEFEYDLGTPIKDFLISQKSLERKKNGQEPLLHRTNISVMLDSKKHPKAKDNSEKPVELEKTGKSLRSPKRDPKISEMKKNKGVLDFKEHLPHKTEGSIPLESKKCRKRQADSDVPVEIDKEHEIEPRFETAVNYLTLPKVPRREKHRQVSDFQEPLLHVTEGSIPLDSKASSIGNADLAIPVEMEKIKDLNKEESSVPTLESILPSTNSDSTRDVKHANTSDKLNSCTKAIEAGLKILQEGGTMEEAKAVCPPDVLSQLIRWHKKRKVYLAPFLQGMRYTSFGRHFTTVDKLQEIVNKLQYYVQSGDMIVDFCCGDNDFSRLMKKNLDASGKRCFFRNYDVIQPKDDSNFERKDWMGIQPTELPTGSKLIIGLNPPFGVDATIANKYIQKALTFKPKLLILIVPKEAKRLDRKQPPYDLIWEDHQLLSVKPSHSTFDKVNDMHIEKRRLETPSLYLWSRPDWAKNFRDIALRRGHESKMRQKSSGDKNEGTSNKKIETECKKRRPSKDIRIERIKKMQTRIMEEEEETSVDTDPRALQSCDSGSHGGDDDNNSLSDSFGFAAGPLPSSLRRGSCGSLDD